MKRLATSLILLCVLWANVCAEDIDMGDTLGLFIATHVNYDVSSDGWDTVFVTVTDCQGNRVGDTVWLATETGKGRWIGLYEPVYVANFTARYHCVYGADTSIERENFTVLDTAAFHGAAAGLDTSQIKTMIQRNWDPDTDGELSVELPTGSGSDTLDIIVFDADTTAVEGVDLCIYNPTKTAKAVPSITTDVNGYCQVNLDPANYPVWCQRLGVIQAEWDTVTVPSGGGRDTIWVVAQDAGSPPSGDLTRVKGYVQTMTNGEYEKGWISFAYHHSNVMDTSESPATFVDPTPIVVFVATGQLFNVDLKPSSKLLSVVQDGPDIPNVPYDVIIWSPGQTTFRWFNICPPETSGAVWLEDLID